MKKYNETYVLSLSPRPHKTPITSKKNAVGTHVGLVGIVRLEALAQRFMGLEKVIYARATHKPAGSEGRGEGRERGNLI